MSYMLLTYGYSIITGVVSSFILYYYTDIALISPAIVTGLLFAVRLFDGAVDPFIGHYMDCRRTRYGKYKGYLIDWSLPFCLFSAFLFIPFSSVGKIGAIVCCAVVYLIWSLLCSIIEAANLSLLVVMTNDSKERYSVNSAKILGGIFAAVTARYAALELVKLLGGGDETKGYMQTAILFAVLGFICIQLSARKIVERNDRGNKPPVLSKAMILIFKDKRIVFMLLFFFAHQMASSIKGQAAIYYMKYIVNQPQLTSLFLITGTLSSLVMQPVIAVCARKIRLSILVPAGYLGGAAGMLLMGTAKTSVPLLFAGNILYGIMVAFPANLLYVYVAELADRQENSGSATMHTLLALFSKFAAAIGGSVISIVLSISNYIPNMIQTQESQDGIKFTYVGLTFILYLAAAAFALLSFRCREGEGI